MTLSLFFEVLFGAIMAGYFLYLAKGSWQLAARWPEGAQRWGYRGAAVGLGVLAVLVLVGVGGDFLAKM